MTTERKPRNSEKEKEEFTLWLAGMLKQQWHLGEVLLRELVIEAFSRADPRLGPMVKRELLRRSNKK